MNFQTGILRPRDIANKAIASELAASGLPHCNNLRPRETPSGQKRPRNRMGRTPALAP
jgi:hypothetical protein